MRRYAAILICLACLTARAADDMRTWTDVDGRKMQAQFLREVDGDVTFLKDGKLVTLPLDRLSEPDQKLIRELETNKKVEDTTPPAGAPRPDLIPLTGDDAQAKSAPSNEARPSLANKRAEAETRNWRDTKGKQTSAKFVRVHDRNVILSRSGRVVSMPFASLSRQDQEYVRELLTARGEGHLVPEVSADNDDPAPANVADNPALPGEAQPAGAPFQPAAVPSASFPAAGGEPKFAGRAMPAEKLQQRMQEQTQKQIADSRQRIDQIHERRQVELQKQNQQNLQQLEQTTKAGIDAYHNQIVAECSNCKKPLTRDQSELKQCPHCGVYWAFEVDQFGKKHEIPGGVARAEVQAQQQNAAQDQPAAGAGFTLTARQQSKLIFRIIIPSIIVLVTAIGGWIARNN